MKRDLHENFEDFLKQSADSLRMKAPERVWKNLSSELNKGRRRVGIGLSAFFLLVSVFCYLTISTTNKQLPLPGQSSSPQQKASFTNENGRTIKSNRAATQNFLASIKQTPNGRQTEQLNGTTTAADMNSAAPDETELITQNDFLPTVVDSYPDLQNSELITDQTSKSPHSFSASNASPWTIESATNAYLEKKKKKGSRFETQFHFSPTISYRKLTENKSYLRSATQPLAQPNYAALYSSVNSMVTHKPDMGFELGVTEKYSVSQKVKIRAGLQFNVNRYDIKAFQAPFALATIALNNRRRARVDSLWTLSNYSNVGVNNNKSSWLQNFSFQVSAPIGVELALKGNDKMQFGIATSVQPTYVLGDRAYMITSDYKSYTQVPWLLRRWNVNTAFETFVSYQSGKTRWQVGPQVRYQLLSSFISNYPVKENLFDFGLKIGVSVNK